MRASALTLSIKGCFDLRVAGVRLLAVVVALAALNGVAVPAFMSALSYYDAYRSARLPANLLQAQRDYFGAHTYQRTDRPGKFHTRWGG